MDWQQWREEYWKLARVLLLDGALFVTILAILLIAFVMMRAMEAVHYGAERILEIENIHFRTYEAVQVILGLDLIFKFLSILVGRKKQ